MAKRSSGSKISTELRLYMTLRTLAGARYLDMIHWRVSVENIGNLVWEVITAINISLTNIKLPSCENDWVKLANGYSSVQKNRWGHIVTPGIALSGDGVVFEILQRSASELLGRPFQTFRN